MAGSQPASESVRCDEVASLILAAAIRNQFNRQLNHQNFESNTIYII